MLLRLIFQNAKVWLFPRVVRCLTLDLHIMIDHWVQVQMYEILLKIIARISNRVFLGERVCRNEEWLRASIKYSENVTKTVMTLRMLPPVLHPIVAMFLPSVWEVQSNLKTAKKILVPIINARREEEKGAPGYQKPTDLLQWMMDAANEYDGQPDKLAHRQLIMSLASVHTTTMAAAHALYDMCAMPEYFEHLRAEVLDVLKEDNGWKKTTLNKMRKMDSFLKESQRMSPASLCKFMTGTQRIGLTFHQWDSTALYRPLSLSPTENVYLLAPISALPLMQPCKTTILFRMPRNSTDSATTRNARKPPRPRSISMP
jgi:hypothetical protein